MLCSGLCRGKSLQHCNKRAQNKTSARYVTPMEVSTAMIVLSLLFLLPVCNHSTPYPVPYAQPFVLRSQAPTQAHQKVFKGGAAECEVIL